MKRLYYYSLLFSFYLISCSTDKQKKIETNVNTLHDQAYAYRDVNKIDSAFILFSEARDLFIQKKDTLGVADCLLNLAILSTNAGDYFGGRAFSLNALDYLNKENKKHYGYLHSNYNNLGITSERLRDYQKAINFYDLAIKFASDTSSIQLYKNNKANTYQEAKQYHDALIIYTQLLKESKAKNSAYARISANIAFTKWHLNASYNALPQLLNALHIRKKENDYWGLNSSYAYLSDYYTNKNLDSALHYAAKMLDVAHRLNSPDDRLFALQKLIKLSPKKLQEVYFENYLKLDDSLQTARNLSKNRFALVKFETEKHKADNLVLQQENAEKTYQVIIIVTVSVLALFIGGFWYRKRQQHIKLNAEKAIKENQLKISKKVHDVVANGLYRVMIEIENEAKLDKEHILDKIEDMYEKSRDISYDHSKANLIAFHDNLRNLIKSFKSPVVAIEIKGNTKALWQKVSTKTQYEIEHIIQELMVNMTKHSHATSVCLTFKQNEGQVSILYLDNGIGIPRELQFKNGLTNTGNRIKNISGNITFGSRTEKGLEIYISFPVS